MPDLTLHLDADQITALVLDLPADELLALADAIEERAETIAMMRLAETGFAEWNEDGEEMSGAEPRFGGLEAELA
jgi:hypothetical protein